MITGNKYGRLTAIKQSPKTKSGERRWLCQCDCGKMVTRGLYVLLSDTLSSCGCAVSDQAKTHGMTDTKEFRALGSMNDRCHNKNNIHYKDYGGRGIFVCSRWRNSFENFFEDMGKSPTREHQIERVDNNKGYSKSNCTWATRKENNQNKRNSMHWFIREMYFKSGRDAAKFFGVTYSTIYRWCNGGGGTKKKRNCHSVRRYKKC